MGIWFSKFNTTSEYDAAKDNLTTPHVSLTKDDMMVHFKPTSSPTLIFEVFKDQACTTKPQVGDNVTKLYVRCNVSLTEGKSWTGGDCESLLAIFAEVAGDYYELSLYIDMSSTPTTVNPFVAGSVIEVHNPGGIEIIAPLVTEFYNE